MIKDIKQIKEHLKDHSEIELPYPFKKDIHIKYITIKDGDESFYVGGKFIKSSKSGSSDRDFFETLLDNLG